MSESPSSIPQAIRAAADLLEQYPLLPHPYITVGSWGVEVQYQLTIETSNLADQKAHAAEIVRTLGGQWDKQELSSMFRFLRKVSPVLKFSISVERTAVCERVVVGTQTVTIPAKPAEPERTVEQEQVEWRCQPLLADAEVSA